MPLLGIGDVPLITKENVPAVFELTRVAKEKLTKIIEDNLQQPKALAQLFQVHSFFFSPPT